VKRIAQTIASIQLHRSLFGWVVLDPTLVVGRRWPLLKISWNFLPITIVGRRTALWKQQ
jgi:hypothetical protein